MCGLKRIRMISDLPKEQEFVEKQAILLYFYTQQKDQA